MWFLNVTYSRWEKYMSELDLAENFGMAEALGIVATLFAILYFSRKQMQSLSRHPNKGSQWLEWKGSQDGRNHNWKTINAKSDILTRKAIRWVRICVLYPVYLFSCIWFTAIRKYQDQCGDFIYDLGFRHLSGSSESLPLISLQHSPDAKIPSPRYAGLFHFAILLPDRGDLATYLALKESGMRFDGLQTI